MHHGRVGKTEGNTSCFLAEKLGNTKEKVTCLPRGHSSSMIPWLASASLLKHNVPAIPTLFGFPKDVLCLPHAVPCAWNTLSSSLPQPFHSSYRGLQVRRYFPPWSPQDDLLSTRSGATSGLPGSHGLPPSLQLTLSLCTKGASPQQAWDKY